jgi:hypothetical protein
VVTLNDSYRHLAHERHQPLTVEFLVELNSRCIVNDGAANQYEREVWGLNDGAVMVPPPTTSQF